MNDFSNWTSGLGQDGWIAAALMLAFFVIIIVTIFLLWQLKLTQHRQKKKKARPFTDQEEQTALDNAANDNKDTASRVEEAEVFITYGLYPQAMEVLQKHLLTQPDDENAKALLEQARQLNEEE